MAVVVGVATVVTKELHRVVGGNVLGVVLHEFLGAFPQSRNGSRVLVQAENEAVLLALLGHQTEGVVVDVAVELDGGLDSPVVFVVHHQWLAEEETRLEAAHVAVGNRVTVDDFALSHVLANLFGLVLVNPFRERPVLLGDLAIESVAGNERCGNLFECIIKGIVVQKDPIVVVSSVEAVLNLTDGASNLPDIAISGKSDESGIHSRTGGEADEIVESGIVGCHGKREIFGIAGQSLLRRRLGAFGCILGLLIGARGKCAFVDVDALVLGVGDEIENQNSLLPTD